jgi:hypothetical protein
MIPCRYPVRIKGKKPVDGSFTKIQSSHFAVPYFCNTPFLGLLPYTEIEVRISNG